MDGVVVDAIAVGIVVVAAGRTYFVVKHPSAIVVSLDGGLHRQGTTEHVVARHTVQTLNVLLGVGNAKTVL